MSENRSPISGAESYRAMGEFWDTHDLTEYWDQSRHVEFEVDIKSIRTYYAVDRGLAAKLTEIARARGISPETLLNLLVQDKIRELTVPQTQKTDVIADV